MWELRHYVCLRFRPQTMLRCHGKTGTIDGRVLFLSPTAQTYRWVYHYITIYTKCVWLRWWAWCVYCEGEFTTLSILKCKFLALVTPAIYLCKVSAMLDTPLSVTKFRKYFTFKLLTSKVTRASHCILYFCIIEWSGVEWCLQKIIELFRKLVDSRDGSCVKLLYSCLV